MNMRISVLVILLTAIFLSCSPDLFEQVGGVLEDEYYPKEAPALFLDGLVAEAAEEDGVLTGAIVPQFSREVTSYHLGVKAGDSIRLMAIMSNGSASSTIVINGDIVPEGEFSQSIAIPAGGATISVIVQAATSDFTYTVEVSRFDVEPASDVSELTSLHVYTESITNTTITEGPNGTELTNVLVWGGDIITENSLSGVSPTHYTNYLLAEHTTVTVEFGTPENNKVYINGLLFSSGDTLPLRIGENRFLLQSVAEDLSNTPYALTIFRQPPPLYGLLISEWAGAYVKDECEDFIEIRNYGKQSAVINSDFRIYIGSTAISLTDYGTNTNPKSFSTLGAKGVTIAADESILIVKSGITTPYLELFLNKHKTPAGTRFFLSNQTKLIGANKRLNERQAYLQVGEEYQWSHTPSPPEDIPAATKSPATFWLKSSFKYGEDSTLDPVMWDSGGKDKLTPGRIGL